LKNRKKQHTKAIIMQQWDYINLLINNQHQLDYIQIDKQLIVAIRMVRIASIRIVKRFSPKKTTIFEAHIMIDDDSNRFTPAVLTNCITITPTMSLLTIGLVDK
jgi:hypothetical protein